jgi:hypothetical protein
MIATISPSKKTLHAAEQDRPDVAAARAELKAEQCKLDASRLVFIDETAVTTKMVRHHGRAPRGERLVASVPHGHWKTLTLVAALRVDALTAPYVIDGAMDGPSFLAYVEQVLVPTLSKGDTVFMDNLRTHKVRGVREAIEKAGDKVREEMVSSRTKRWDETSGIKSRRSHRPLTAARRPFARGLLFVALSFVLGLVASLLFGEG